MNAATVAGFLSVDLPAARLFFVFFAMLLVPDFVASAMCENSIS